MSTRDSLELFSGNPFRQSLFHLVLRHVDKQVGYIENGIAVFQSDIDIHFLPSFVNTTPMSASGMQVHWYFLIPP